ncbi:hypothetical protein Tco_1294915 [Tanacetum coccineum]
MLQDVKSWLRKCFAMKDLGEAAYILGIKIYRDRSRQLIALNQSAYIDKTLKRYRMDTSKRSIMYAVRCTRPDVAFSQNLTSRYQQNPGKSYWTAIWETDRDVLRSHIGFGFVFMMNGGVVDWKRSKQNTTAMSSMEAKYIAVIETAMEAIWIRAITIADEPGVQRGAKHFRQKYHFIREAIQEGDVRILKVHTYDNLADSFTKPMPYTKHVEHARTIGLRPAGSFL